MASESRTTKFTALHKILQKHFTPVAVDPNRTLLEHMLFACCLENSRYKAAEETFAALTHTFFDWNEIRVTSVKELSEVMHRLPNPSVSAVGFKRMLHCIFEGDYSFDIEGFRKGNLGPTIKKLHAVTGTTPFIVSYVVQAGLGGHSIPLDQGVLDALYITDFITKKEKEKGNAAGLERAIPKAKGIEFGSLLHQLGAELMHSPYGTKVRAMLLSVNPDCGVRIPKRRAARKVEEPVAETAEEQPSRSKAAKKKASKEAEPKTTAPAKKVGTAKKQVSEKKSTADAGKKKAAAKKTSGAKSPALKTKKSTSDAPKKKTVTKKSTTAKKSAAQNKNAAPQKKTSKKSTHAKKSPTQKKSSTSQIGKRKPR